MYIQSSFVKNRQMNQKKEYENEIITFLHTWCFKYLLFSKTFRRTRRNKPSQISSQLQNDTNVQEKKQDVTRLDFNSQPFYYWVIEQHIKNLLKFKGDLISNGASKNLFQLFTN
jgi:hypothetical protein